LDKFGKRRWKLPYMMKLRRKRSDLNSLKLIFSPKVTSLCQKVLKTFHHDKDLKECSTTAAAKFCQFKISM